MRLHSGFSGFCGYCGFPKTVKTAITAETAPVFFHQFPVYVLLSAYMPLAYSL